MDEFKTMLKKKADGIIKEKKPSAATLRSNKGGGKFNVPIFSGRMNIFRVFQTCKIVFQGCIDSHIYLFPIFKQNHFQLRPTQPKKQVTLPFSFFISISVLTLARPNCFLDFGRFFKWMFMQWPLYGNTWTSEVVE